MKKIYILAIALFGTFAFGQNMLQNYSFENWTETAPENWLITLGNNGGSVELETTNVQDGNNAVKLVAPNGTGNNRVGHLDFEVTPGTSYTLTYWYFDEDDNARFRHWGSFRTGTLESSTTTGVTQVPEFQPNYLENSNGWTQVTATGVAPSNGDIMRLDFRVFQQDNGQGGGTVYVDNIDFRVTGSASVKNNEIAGLNIYPNPVTGNTLYVTSFNSVEKSVAIFDVLGKQVINATTVNGAVNVANLNAGVYIVKVTEEGKTATKKLVVK